MSMNNLCSLSSIQWMPMCCTCRWFQCTRYYVGTVISIFKCTIWPILESKDAQHCWIPCFTLGQRVVKKGIKLSLNMAPEAKIAARRLGLRLFLHKITTLNAFWDTYEVSKRGSVDSWTRELSFDTKLEYFWPAIGNIQRKRSELSVGYRFCARRYW